MSTLKRVTYRSYGTPNAAGRPPPSIHRIEAEDGVILRALEWKGNEGIAFQLLHGANGNATMWQMLADAFPDRRVISSDHRGYGDTDGPPGTCTSEWHVRDTESIRRALNIGKPVLIGFSGGAVDSIHYAATHPGAISALVMIDPPMFAPPPKEAMDFFARARTEFSDIDDYVDAARAGPLMRDIGLTAARLYATYVMRPGEDGVWRRLLLPHTQKEWNDSLGKLDVWGFAAEVRVPTLVVRAGAAPFLPQEVAERLVTRLRDGRLAVIERSSHSVPFHDPDALHAAIRDFVEDIESNTGLQQEPVGF